MNIAEFLALLPADQRSTAAAFFDSLVADEIAQRDYAEAERVRAVNALRAALLQVEGLETERDALVAALAEHQQISDAIVLDAEAKMTAANAALAGLAEDHPLRSIITGLQANLADAKSFTDTRKRAAIAAEKARLLAELEKVNAQEAALAE